MSSILFLQTTPLSCISCLSIHRHLHTHNCNTRSLLPLLTHIHIVRYTKGYFLNYKQTIQRLNEDKLSDARRLKQGTDDHGVSMRYSCNAPMRKKAWDWPRLHPVSSIMIVTSSLVHKQTNKRVLFKNQANKISNATCICMLMEPAIEYPLSTRVL